MKAITIRQPWASLIAEGIKDIENRTWTTKFRGRVLIHSSCAKFVNDLHLLLDYPQILDVVDKKKEVEIFGSYLIKGSIIGSVEVIDCVLNHSSIWAEHTAKKETRKNKAGVIFVDEIEVPVYNWVLANPIIFLEPIPAKGKLSFWDYPNILAEPEEKDGELFCHCQLPVKERNQVMNLAGEYRCRYCGGKWYK